MSSFGTPASPLASSSIRFVLNGAEVVVRDVEPTSTTLLAWLRANGHTGTKEGCAEGDCGACTVALAELDVDGKPTWRAMNSCIALLPMLHGREIVTVEGIASRRGHDVVPHAVQEALLHHGGSQCGYCTPGFVVSMFEAHEREDVVTHDDMADQLCGNLCRCTGYRPIREAMCDVLRSGADTNPAHDTLVSIGRQKRAHHEHASATANTPVDVKVTTRFLRPTSLDELLQLRAQHPEARLVAGATEIGVELTKRGTVSSTLISTEGVAALRTVHTTEHGLLVGGAATLTTLEDALKRSHDVTAPAIRKMLRVFASRQIRNRATLAGNVVTASPIGDMPPVLLALDATVVLGSLRGERRVPVAEFFVGYRKTVLAADELVIAIELPHTPDDVTRLFDTFKVSKRKEMDISIVAAAFRLDIDAHGKIAHARLAYGGVAPTPARAVEAEALLVGRSLDHALDDDVMAALARAFTPIDDARASAAYRRGLIVSLFERHVRGVESEALDEPVRFREEGAWRDAEAHASRELLHDSARGHVTGSALYVDDSAQQRTMLDVWPVTVPHAHARILRRDATLARALPGVHAVLFAEDIPGDNDVGAIRKDEVLLAFDVVSFHGQPVALVVADSVDIARRAAKAVVVEVEALPPVLGIRDAIEKGSFHTVPHVIARGDVDDALAKSPRRMTGELDIGGQEHFYLESHAAFAEWSDDDGVRVVSSTQHPSEVQAVVSHVLHLPRNRVVVESPRMGGGFGGKETQGNTWAALVALASMVTHKPVRVQLDRDLDMQLTGKRHPFLARYDAGFDDDGTLLALRVDLVSDGGWALDLSESICDRALFHLSNTYFIPHVRFAGRVAKTHVVSHTAFRGFGGPQGVLVVEDVLSRIAMQVGVPGEVVRARNLYRDSDDGGDTNTTHYGQHIDDNRIGKIWGQLTSSSRITERRADIAAFNAASPYVKRGIAMTPVQFGISFTASFLNQAGALVVIYRDGTVQVNHGGTEMGQGLASKMQGVAARELGALTSSIRVMKTRTDKVPNTSATAASSGADLNGAAVQLACAELRERLRPIAAGLLAHKLSRGVSGDDVVFADGFVSLREAVRLGTDGVGDDVRVPFGHVAERAYFAQVGLSATGYYRTPDIGYDRSIGRGKPFHYFSYGAAVAEVELDGLTGMKRVRRVDILHDVGDSLNPSIDRGQIEGGFIQGMGWLTAEELLWSSSSSKVPGALLTHSASTYQIPTIGDAPEVFVVELLSDAAQSNVVHGSKAVGEPPLVLALSVREALREAVRAFDVDGREVVVPSPLTHEVLFRAVQERRVGGAERARAVNS